MPLFSPVLDELRWSVRHRRWHRPAHPVRGCPGCGRRETVEVGPVSITVRVIPGPERPGWRNLVPATLSEWGAALFLVLVLAAAVWL